MEARGGGDGGFSPRATVEDIQRRLLRPSSSSLHSPPPTSLLFSRDNYAQGRKSSQFEAKKGGSTSKKRKLEDYLDPVLLSAVSSKISLTVKREVRDFEWPVDDLKMLTEDTAVEKDDAVNLGNNSDNRIGNDEYGDVEFSTPFEKFEHSALVWHHMSKKSICWECIQNPALTREKMIVCIVEGSHLYRTAVGELAITVCNNRHLISRFDEKAFRRWLTCFVVDLLLAGCRLPPPRTRIDACPLLMKQKNHRDTRFAFDVSLAFFPSLWASGCYCSTKAVSLTPFPSSLSYCQSENARKKCHLLLTFVSISNQPVMAQQDDGWPLGLRLLNARVGLLENRDFRGSISFNTLPTGSPISFTDSSDLDSESSGSFFHAKRISLGSLIGGSTSSVMELSTRSSTGLGGGGRGSTEASVGVDTKINNFRFKYKPWLFSLCCKLSNDAVIASRTHSLAHFLEMERRKTVATTRPLPIAGGTNNMLTS